MRKNLLLGAFAVFGLSTTLVAQEKHFNCGNYKEQTLKLWAEHPELEADYYHLLHKSKTTGQNKSGDDTTVYTIPIVFHILHEYGSENITDAQVIDAVAILNEDYSNTNPDNNTAVAPFDTVVGTAKIRFKLANLDPYGNCTNGIEHIYTHMANYGDDFSKLHQWNRKEYLNVWVTNTIGSSGVAGYAYYPNSTEGNFFWADGIYILNDYIGSIGTSNPGSSRALTHEIGHWLSLSHTWGNNNENNVACGDDAALDTPETKGSPTGVCNYNANTCNDTDQGSSGYWPIDVQDQVQNYMDYSYCSMMFTKMQVNQMRNTLNEETAYRNNLWVDSNLVLTLGSTDFNAAPVQCAPIADFHILKHMICVGDNATYKNDSYNGTVDTYAWSFPGGTPATSSSPNPTVTYAQPGFYSATLTVSNAAGSSTKTITNVVYASAPWVEHNGPYVENFNSGNDFWISQNPENNHAYFHRIPSNGVDNSACYMLNNWKDVSNAAQFSDDYFYYDRLGYSKDSLTTASYDLSNTTGVTVSFDYAYGTKGTSLDVVTEKLVVYSSRDCGKTWTQRKLIQDEDLLTVGYVGNNNFMPNNNSQWKTASFSYTPNSSDTKTRFRFAFTASDVSSNLFIDNFNVSGTLGIADANLGTISVSPNPVAAGSDLNIEVSGNTEDMELIVLDTKGAIVNVISVPNTNGTQTINVPMNVAKGCYFINAVQGANKTTHKVVVY
jgi:hypothetical protein